MKLSAFPTAPASPRVPAGAAPRAAVPAGLPGRRSRLACGDDSDDSDEDLAEDEDLTAQPVPEEESAFDDFDDDFDDDFEEEENDPDWDPPEENEPPPPPAKGPAKRK